VSLSRSRTNGNVDLVSRWAGRCRCFSRRRRRTLTPLWGPADGQASLSKLSMYLIDSPVLRCAPFSREGGWIGRLKIFGEDGGSVPAHIGS
jgi:hypothetical protein